MEREEIIDLINKELALQQKDLRAAETEEMKHYHAGFISGLGMARYLLESRQVDLNFLKAVREDLKHFKGLDLSKAVEEDRQDRV